MIIHGKPRIFLTVLLCAMGATCSDTSYCARRSDQSQDTSTPKTLRATTRVVVLDVVVTNQQDHPIQNLKKENFSVLEDGREQTVAAFDEASSRVIPVKIRNAPAEDILLIDEINAQFRDLAYARYCLSKLLRKNKGQLEQPTSLMALTNEGLVVIHGPTFDGNALFEALNHHHPKLPMLLGLGGRYNEMERISISLAALHQIATGGAGSNVRRSIIWITPGFPMLSNSFINFNTQEQLFEEIRRLSSELQHARMVVYTVDPRGVPSSFDSLDFSGKGFGQSVQVLANRGSFNFSDIALQRFTKETGGKSLWGRNDLDNEVARSIVDGAHYYTISYYPSNDNFDGKFRKIAIKVDRPKSTARTRAGYFALPDVAPPTKDQIEAELEEALRNPVSYSGIQLTAAEKTKTSPTHLQSIRLKLDRGDLTCKPSVNDVEECSLIAAMASFSTKPKPIEIRSHSFTITVPTTSTSSNEPVTLNLTMSVGSQITRWRVIVRDEASGRMGSLDLVP